VWGGGRQPIHLVGHERFVLWIGGLFAIRMRFYVWGAGAGGPPVVGTRAIRFVVLVFFPLLPIQMRFYVCRVGTGRPFGCWKTSDSFCGSGVFLRFECAFTCGGRVRGALRLLEHDGFVLWCWCSSLFCRFKCASTCVEWGREGHSVVGTRWIRFVQLAFIVEQERFVLWSGCFFRFKCSFSVCGVGAGAYSVVKVQGIRLIRTSRSGC